MRALIVDADNSSRQRLRELLPTDLAIEVVGECETGLEAIAAVREKLPDLVFLDVQIPDLSGFDVVAALDPAEQPLVIFTTADEEYAVKAFEVSAFDYLLKPVEAQRLRLACERACERLAEMHSTTTVPFTRAFTFVRDRLVVRTGNSMTLLKTCEIRWIEACGNYVRLHTTSGVHTVREKLANLQSILDPKAFARVHRSTIVNIERITSLQPWFSGELIVIMDDGTELKLTRTYRRELESRVHFLF